jgi:NRAMP (natural resistance-associated macrophage protein)-like metal ion transporter
MQNHRPIQNKREPSVWSILRHVGPGIVTGASDDDPSGIATYSQAGAQFGFGLLWLAVASYPLMCAIQEISARIGRVTGCGLAANLAKIYPRPLVASAVLLLLVSSIFNLGADLSAMGESMHMLVGGARSFHIFLLGVASLLLQIFVPYTRYVNYLKWLSLSLLAYVITVFFVHVPWAAVLRAMVIPPVQIRQGKYIAMCVAVLGTTISPYLFFWQASQEAEEVIDRRAEKPLRKAPKQAAEQLLRIKWDTYLGMAASNIVAFFIMLTTAATLHVNGNSDIQTAAQAAKALEPLAGHYAHILFSFGIIGTGLLAVPVLAGSSAYAVGELMHWRISMEAKPWQAAKFNLALAFAVLLGLALDIVRFDPIRALVVAAILNGVLAAPLMALILLLAQNNKVMGQFTLPRYLLIAGWIGTTVMACSSIAFLVAALG